MDRNTKKLAFIHAGTTAMYVFLVSSFLFYAPNLIGPDAKTVLIPIVMLLLLVFSVAIVGVLIFGRPVVWYLEGKKKEAMILLAYTLTIFFLITAFCFILLFFLTSVFKR